jgi:pSer/pThr/pTyr-binding forkhead associated (FHA) protein
MSNSLHLIVLSGESAGRRYSVAGKKSLKLGRSSSNDIQISDERLSRMHCLFECTDVGEVYVLDLASANGTFVNGEKLSKGEEKLLSDGDVIKIGVFELYFSHIG